MVIQHNLQSMNANRMLGGIVSQQAKSTEKLSSGYRINRAADDAAGLSISEKMRGQIRGLNKASTNAQDGISLIQTAEGALNESHSILQRMRELSVQAANGTETNDDRAAIQNEIVQLTDELTRIADTTEFNTMKLLDGSLGGAGSTVAGPAYGAVESTTNSGALGSLISSDKSGVSLSLAGSTSVKAGAEYAVWNAAGTTLTLNLVSNASYSQSDIDKLIQNAKQVDNPTANPANITVKVNGAIKGTLTSGTATEGGVKASATGTVTPDVDGGAASITIESNKYGKELNGVKISFIFDKAPGSETVDTKTEQTYSTSNSVSSTGAYEIHLAQGKKYSESDIESLLNKAGLDVDVKLKSTTPDKGGAFIYSSTGFNVSLSGGAGLGSSTALFGQSGYGASGGSGGGVTLHIGANEGQTMSFSINNMSASALGVEGLSIGTTDGAESAITTVDNAIKKVSEQRSKLGAVQNRLEHTISNLDNTAENLQSAESGIRDLDMATEMVTYSKNNILQQAAQSMLAQANQSTQGVLSLLQ